jgi:hypothetical protein
MAANQKRTTYSLSTSGLKVSAQSAVVRAVREVEVALVEGCACPEQSYSER